MGNLCKFKVTEAELVEADERATEETGQTWSPMQYYTREEDEQILRYIINHQKFAWAGGRTLWKKMEEEKLLEGRNWGSMMSRFHNYIMENLGSYDLTEEQQNSLREKTMILDETGKVEADGKMRPKHNYTMTEDKVILDYIISHNQYHGVGGAKLWKEMEKESVLGGRSWQGMKLRFHGVIMEDLESYNLTNDQTASFKEKGGNLARRYIPSEDAAILLYINNKRAYSKVRRDQLWKNMEKERVLGDRSWKSMKHRFLRYILKNIGDYNLTEEQISSFKNEVEEKDEEDEDDNKDNLSADVAVKANMEEVGVEEQNKDMEEDELGAAFISVDF